MKILLYDSLAFYYDFNGFKVFTHCGKHRANMRSLSEQRSPLDMIFQANTKHNNFQGCPQRSPSKSADIPDSFYLGVGADLKDLKPNQIARYIKSDVADICHFLPPLSHGTGINNDLESSPPIRRIHKSNNTDTRSARSNSFLSPFGIAPDRRVLSQESPNKLSNNLDKLRRNIGLPIDPQTSNSSELPNEHSNNNRKQYFKNPNQSMELSALWSQDERKRLHNRDNLQYNLETQDSEIENEDQLFKTYHRNQKGELTNSSYQPHGALSKPSISPKQRNKVHTNHKTRLDSHFPFSPKDEIEQSKQQASFKKHLPLLNNITNKKIYQNQTRLRHSAHLDLKEHPPTRRVLNSKPPSHNLKQNARYQLNTPIDHTFINFSPRKSELNSRILQEIQQLEVGFQHQEKEHEMLLKASQKQCIRDFQETCMYRALQPEISKLKPLLPSIPALSLKEKRSSSANLKKPHQKAFLFSGTGLKERQEIKAMINSLENYSHLIKETTKQRKSQVRFS